MNGAGLRIQLFLISYTPLAMIFGVRAIPATDHARLSDWFAAIGFVVLGVLGLGMATRLLRGAQQVSAVAITVTKVQDEGSNAAGYLATYLFPFILFYETSWRAWIAYGIYVFVLALVTVRSNLILVNPTLYILRRRVVLIDFHTARGTGTADPQSRILICGKTPKIGDQVRVVRFADGYLESQR